MKDFYSKKEIKLLGEKTGRLILAGDVNTAFRNIKPILGMKCSFPLLDFLGRKIGEASVSQPQKFFEFFDLIIDYKAMGGFVIVGLKP